jgi:hypothetical protein
MARMPGSIPRREFRFATGQDAGPRQKRPSPIGAFSNSTYCEAGHAQRFLSAFGIISSHFRPGRHLCTVGVYRQMIKSRISVWEEVVVDAPGVV